MRARGNRWMQRLALAFGSVLIFLVVWELVLRLCGYGNLEIYQPDAKLYWRLRPNQDCYTKVDHQPVHINSHGTRGPEFAAEKPANTIRILCLGDSRTFGWGLPDEKTYSRQLERMLQEWVKGEHSTFNIQRPTSNAPLTPERSAAVPAAARTTNEGLQNSLPPPASGTAAAETAALRGPWRVEVINAGVNAWSFLQMQVFFRDFGLKWSPDFVILGEANLWTQFSEKNSDEFVKKFMSRVRLKNLLRRCAIYHFAIEVKLQAYYQRYRTKFIPVDPKQDQFFKEQQQSDPDTVFRTAIEQVCQTAQSNGVKPVLLFLPTLDELSSTNASRVLVAKRAVSTKLDVPLVDLTPELAKGGKTLYLQADPVHLNASGNELVARRLFESITNTTAK